jgi:ribose 1,5-bisphosphokinase
MSWISAAWQSLAAMRLIGPGRLLLVVGPSGAGKDTLIGRAREACRHDAAVVFPPRVVTRPPSEFEDNRFVPIDAFQHAAEAGAFALWWSAHGNMYAITRSVDVDLSAGRAVVCNVSRTVVEAARRRYANVVAVLVTAPPAVLADRLAARGRASDGGVTERMTRNELAGAAGRPDVVIDNVGDPARGTRKLLNTIYATGFFVD